MNFQLAKNQTFLRSFTIIVALMSSATAAAKPFDVEFGEQKLTESPLGNSRILVICLPDHATIESKQADPLYMSIDWSGFEERDLVIVEMRNYSAHVVKEHFKGIAVPRYKIPYSGRYIAGTGSTGVGLASRCDNKLEYVLIGKDGTQKRRWDLFPSNSDLYTIIDAMPMRRFEMRQQKEKN